MSTRGQRRASPGGALPAATLPESEARFASVFRRSPIGIAVSRTADGRFIDVNPAFARLVGWPLEELVGRTASEIGLWIDPVAAPSRRRRGEAGKEPASERRFRRKTGETGQVWMSEERITLGGRPHRLALVVDVTRRKRVEKALEVSQEALRSLASQLRSAREEERTRLARTVHDELGHAFTDLKLDLAWLDRRLGEAGAGPRQATRLRVTAMMRRVEEHLGTVRQIATDLRPALLDSVGLGPALEAEARQFGRRTRIACHLALPSPFPALDPGRSTALFRIFQEILANVARHAFASTLRIRLGTGEGRVELEVTDDGRGIEPAAAAGPQAIGLLGMRERALEFGGDVTLQGSPGRGTTVRAWLPWDTAMAAHTP